MKKLANSSDMPGKIGKFQRQRQKNWQEVFKNWQILAINQEKLANFSNKPEKLAKFSDKPGKIGKLQR